MDAPVNNKNELQKDREEVCLHVWRNIRKLCELYKIDREELYRYSGVYANMPRNFTLYTIIRIATFLGVSLDELVFKLWYEEKDVKRWEKRKTTYAGRGGGR